MHPPHYLPAAHFGAAVRPRPPRPPRNYVTISFPGPAGIILIVKIPNRLINILVRGLFGILFTFIEFIFQLYLAIIFDVYTFGHIV